MKKIHAVLVSSLFLLSYANQSTAAIETYKFDTNHSCVEWRINHFGFSNPSGKWFVEGTLDLDTKKPKKSKVNVTIEVANIITGIPELDKHLKDKLFFDVAQFPTATFVSSRVAMLSKSSAKIYGKLTVHGITHPVVLFTKLNKMGVNPINDKLTVGFSATTKLKRSDYNISTLLPGLGDDVNITIEIEANKAT